MNSEDRLNLHEAMALENSAQLEAVECMIRALIATHPDREKLAAGFVYALGMRMDQLRDVGFDLSLSVQSTQKNVQLLQKHRDKWLRTLGIQQSP